MRRRRRARLPRRKADEPRAAAAAAAATAAAAAAALLLFELREASLHLLRLRLPLLQLCAERGCLRAARTRPNVRGRRTLELCRRRSFRRLPWHHLRRRLILLWITHHGA